MTSSHFSTPRIHVEGMELIKLFILLSLSATCLVNSQVTNVLYSVQAAGSGSYGASTYVTNCGTIPTAVKTKYPLCTGGTPLGGLTVSSNVTHFRNRIVLGSVVSPNGTEIASNVAQFYTGTLSYSLAAAGISCTTFYSGALPVTGETPSNLNDECSIGAGNSLGSASGLRTSHRGSCTSVSAGTWFSSSTAACNITTSYLCFCSSINTPTASPTLPTSSPSKAPSQVPSRNPTRSPTLRPSLVPTGSPTLPTNAPSKSPSKTPSQTPSRSPTLPTSSPSKTPTVTTPTQSPSVSPTLAPTYANAITNVIYVGESEKNGKLTISSFRSKCAAIPTSVLTNFPNCQSGLPLASLRSSSKLTDFNSLMTTGTVVGPNGLLIAQNPAQFYTGTLNLSLISAELTCKSNYFFTATLPNGTVNNNGRNECSKTTTGDFLEEESETYKYTRGACNVQTPGWFSHSTTKCKDDVSFLCFCRVFVTPAPTLVPSRAPQPPSPSVAPTRVPSQSPSKPTRSPSKVPTTSTPTKSPTRAATLQPTYPNSVVNVVYVGASSTKGNYGATNYLSVCETIPDQVLENYPLCTVGSPLASMKAKSNLVHFNSRVTSGKVVGPYGLLIADSPTQFYNGNLTRSLSAAGVGCSTFFSGSTVNGLADTTKSKAQCAEDSNGDFFEDDDDDETYNRGSCTVTTSGWFMTGTADCDVSTSLLCYCRVFQTDAPTVASTLNPTVDIAALAGSNAASEGTVIATVTGALTGLFAALFLLAIGFILISRHGKMTHLPMTTATTANNAATLAARQDAT